AVITIARLFWLSWLTLLFNIVLVGFPMDGGWLFQCLLWQRLGLAQSMRAAIFAGIVTALVVGVISIFVEELLLLCLSVLIYLTCRKQLVDWFQIPGHQSPGREDPARP